MFYLLFRNNQNIFPGHIVTFFLELRFFKFFCKIENPLTFNHKCPVCFSVNKAVAVEITVFVVFPYWLQLR